MRSTGSAPEPFARGAAGPTARDAIEITRSVKHGEPGGGPGTHPVPSPSLIRSGAR
jgi:hypothetical protein